MTFKRVESDGSPDYVLLKGPDATYGDWFCKLDVAIRVQLLI